MSESCNLYLKYFDMKFKFKLRVEAHLQYFIGIYDIFLRGLKCVL